MSSSRVSRWHSLLVASLLLCACGDDASSNTPPAADDGAIDSGTDGSTAGTGGAAGMSAGAGGRGGAGGTGAGGAGAGGAGAGGAAGGEPADDAGDRSDAAVDAAAIDDAAIDDAAIDDASIIDAAIDDDAAIDGSPADDDAGFEDAGEVTCVDYTESTTACGLNGRGTQDRVCFNGEWRVTGGCDDVDECSDDAQRIVGCGLNGYGTLPERCVEGSWAADGGCTDPDQCVEGDSFTEPCEAGDGSTRVVDCFYGGWRPGYCTLPPGPCEGDVIVTDWASYALRSQCTSISGSLRAVTDELVLLPDTMRWPLLTEVGGDVELRANEADRIELPLLEHVGGDLSLSRSYYSVELDAPALRSVEGSLRVSNTMTLEHELLEEIGGDLIISRAVLTTLALPALTSVLGDVWIGDWQTVSGTALTHLDGLSSLEMIGGSLVIAGNNHLTSLEGLSDLASIGGDLLLRYNPKLADLSSLRGLTAIPGDLRVGHIYGDPIIYGYGFGTEVVQTSLAGLENIATVGGDVELADMELTTLGELESLQQIGGTLILDELGYGLEVIELPQLTELGGLEVRQLLGLTRISLDVTEVADDIRLLGTFFVRTVEMPELETLGGTLEVERLNWYREDSEAPNELRFPKLKSAGSIQLIDLGVIAGLHAFPELVNVTGDLSITLLDSQTGYRPIAVSDFGKLEAVGGDLNLFTTSVTSIAGFDVLESIGGALTLVGGTRGAPSWQHDQRLITVSAFDQLGSVESLEIGGFRSLTACWPERLVQQLWPEGGGDVDLWSLPSCEED